MRLMPPSYVKPYVKRQKNDMADAEAICEAVSRPTMRFVPIKSEVQQSVLMLHRARELLIRQRTMLINALRGHLAEFGIIMRQRKAGVGTLVALIEDDEQALIDRMTRDALRPLVAQLREMHERIGQLDRHIHAYIDRMLPADDLRQFPASVRLRPALLSRPSQIPACSDRGVNSRLGLGLSHARTPAAARIGSATSLKRATATSGVFL